MWGGLAGSTLTSGRAIAEAVSLRLPTAAARVTSCVICGGRSVTGVGFLLVLRFTPPILIPPIAPQSPSSGAGTIDRSIKWTHSQSHPLLTRGSRDLQRCVYEDDDVCVNAVFLVVGPGDFSTWFLGTEISGFAHRVADAAAALWWWVWIRERERETPGTGAVSEPIGIKRTMKYYNGLKQRKKQAAQSVNISLWCHSCCDRSVPLVRL
jgi:hypothetical protein